MPGQLPLDTKYYPSDFQVMNQTITPGLDDLSHPLLYADRMLVIDSIVVTQLGAPTTTGFNMFFTSMTSAGESVGGTTETTIYRVITSGISIAQSASNRVYKRFFSIISGTPSATQFTLDTTDNVLSAGSTLFLQYSAYMQAANLAASASSGNQPPLQFMIQIRYRSQL